MPSPAPRPMGNPRGSPSPKGGAAVGIDLGTSNTVVAHVKEGRARAVAAAAGGDVLVPSYAAFHPSGAVLVGKEAKERRLQDPKNTIFSTKRLIGRPWSSKEVAQARARLPFDLREGKNASVVVAARGQEYTLPEISAFVLRKVKALAELAVLAPIDRAVITVPANFDDLQRAATKLAGQLAGLQVLRVLNEPTAAALAYGYGKEGQERILVYDFGGGTFDVTVLEREGGVFQVRSTAGDTYLGGDDIDSAVAARIAEGFNAQHFYDPRADRDVFEHVRAAAEKLKMKLSSDDVASIALEDVAFGVGGKSLRYEHEMKRAELAEIADPFIERSFKVVKRALDEAGVVPSQIDQVLLVGGTTLIPRVRERVTAMFQREPATGLSPFEAVAIGASIQAYAMTEPQSAQDDSTGATAASVALSRDVVAVEPAPFELVEVPPEVVAPAPEPDDGATGAPVAALDEAPDATHDPPAPQAPRPRRGVGAVVLTAVGIALVALGLAIALR